MGVGPGNRNSGLGVRLLTHNVCVLPLWGGALVAFAAVKRRSKHCSAWMWTRGISRAVVMASAAVAGRAMLCCGLRQLQAGRQFRAERHASTAQAHEQAERVEHHVFLQVCLLCVVKSRLHCMRGSPRVICVLSGVVSGVCDCVRPPLILRTIPALPMGWPQPSTGSEIFDCPVPRALFDSWPTLPCQ